MQDQNQDQSNRSALVTDIHRVMSEALGLDVARELLYVQNRYTRNTLEDEIVETVLKSSATGEQWDDKNIRKAIGAALIAATR